MSHGRVLTSSPSPISEDSPEEVGIGEKRKSALPTSSPQGDSATRAVAVAVVQGDCVDWVNIDLEYFQHLLR